MPLLKLKIRQSPLEADRKQLNNIIEKLIVEKADVDKIVEVVLNYPKSKTSDYEWLYYLAVGSNCFGENGSIVDLDAADLIRISKVAANLVELDPKKEGEIEITKKQARSLLKKFKSMHLQPRFNSVLLSAFMNDFVATVGLEKLWDDAVVDDEEDEE